MMHGREKSDSAIVAGKPTNKAVLTAAEPVERRAEAKGNASQQSTRRAQDRESVSQALERIRQVARQRNKERFTSLFHHLSVELLRVAFFALKRDAAPGVDGLTWQDYEADLDRKMEDLHASVPRCLPAPFCALPLVPEISALPISLSSRTTCSTVTSARSAPARMISAMRA
jgi:RNA-directed DNA polymerase